MSILKPVFAIGSAVWFLMANTSIEAPRIGFVRLPNQEVWAIRGIAGTFYFGQRAAATVDQHAFNGRAGIRTLGEHAELLGANGEAMRIAHLEGKILQTGLSMTDESAYVLTDRELWRLDRGKAERFLIPDLVPERGRVMGITGTAAYVDLAIAFQGQIEVRRVWFETEEAMVLETYTGTPEQFVFLPDGMALWSDYGVLMLKRADGSVTQVDCGVRTLSLSPMNKDLVHAAGSDGRQFVVQLLAGADGVSLRMLQMPVSPE